jgi:hypothetical protein
MHRCRSDEGRTGKARPCRGSLGGLCMGTRDLTFSAHARLTFLKSCDPTVHAEHE